MEVRIYLENYQIDTDENSIIAMTMCYSYLEDPTTVAGDYSKTIKIPGTVNNHKIFGQIWNLDRTVLFGNSNTSVYFNPSKKTEAKIYIGPELFKIGYVQLNNIIKDKNVVSYEITFYSELCNVLHNLLDSSLCNLNLPSNGLRHIVNSSNIDSINNSSYHGLRNYMKYGLTIDGVYDNFRADYWLTKDSSGNVVVGPMDNNGTKYDTAMILQAYSPKVRPMVFVSTLLDQIRDDYNRDSSTKFIYDDDYFFNGANPYCVNSVMSCKNYDTDNASTVQVSLTANNFQGNFGADGGRVRLVLNDNNSGFVDENGNLDLSSLTSSTDLNFECMLRITGNLNSSQWQSATSSYSNNYYGRRFTSNYTSASVKLILVDAETGADAMSIYPTNTPWYTSDIPLYNVGSQYYYSSPMSPVIYEREANTATFELAFRNSFVTGVNTEYRQNPNTHESAWIEVPQYSRMYTNLDTNGYLNLDGIDDYYGGNMYDDSWKYVSDNDYIGVTDYFPFRFSSYGSSASRTGKYKVYIELTGRYNKLKCVNKGNTNTEIDITGWQIYGRCGSAGTIADNDNHSYIYRNRQSFQAFNASTHYNCPVTSTSGKNCSFSGNTGITSGSYVSFKDMVDSDITQGDFLINFSKLFGLIYDTDNIAYDNTIRLKTRNSYHKDYKIHDWTDKIDYSKSFKQTPLTFKTKYLSLAYNPMESYYEKKYLKTYDDAYGIQKIDTGFDFNDNTTQLLNNQLFKQTVMVKGEALLNGGAVPAYFDKTNNERSPIDAQYSLLFWNQDSSLNNYTPTIQIIDDIAQMHDASAGGDDEPCWVDTIRLSYYRNVKLHAPSTLRSHEVQQTADKTIVQTFSWDLGYPQSNYAKWSTITYPSSATIYSNYWKSYIADLYDVNTRILKCYVYLTPAEMIKFSFKDFVKIGDTLWHPNQIIDYNPLSKNPVQVELIKVNDITAYTDSQTKWYDYLDVTFTVGSTDYPTATQTEILTPVSGGVITTSSGKNNYIGKFLRGSGFIQSFSYVGDYKGVYSVSAKYYDSISGQNIDCTEWFNQDTLTFTVPENTVNGPITVTLDIKSGSTFYNVICEDNDENNVKYTAVIPTGSIPSRIPEGSELKILVSKKNTVGDWSLISKSVTMGGTNITSTAFDESTGYVHIPSVTGEVILNFAYIETSDILLPYLMNSTDDFASNYNVKKNVYFNTGVTATTYNTSIEAITAGNNNYTTAHNSAIMGMVKGVNQSNTKEYEGLALYNSCSTNTAAFTMYMDKSEISSDGTKYAAYPYGEGASYPIRVLKGGANKYDSQYFLDDKTASAYSSYPFLQIDDQIKLTITSESLSSSDLTQIYLFGAKKLNSGQYLADALTKIYTARIFENNACKGDYHPVLHWENGTFTPCFYDSITKAYLKNLGSDEVHYILDSHEDIYLSWIGNGTGAGLGDTWFTVNGIFSEDHIGIQVVSSIDNYPGGDSAIFCFNGQAGPTNAVDSRMFYFDINSGNFKLEWGVTDTDEQVYVDMNAPSFKTLMTTTCYTAPSSKKAVGIINGDLYKSEIASSYSAVETLKLFKTRDANSYKGIKIYEVRAFSRITETTTPSTGSTILDTYNDTQTSAYLRPVLHYTGTTKTFTTQEGFKAPAGYEPCFKDVMSGLYYYMTSSSTTPTINFGFYE
jgi:hypothetical protein